MEAVDLPSLGREGPSLDWWTGIPSPWQPRTEPSPMKNSSCNRISGSCTPSIKLSTKNLRCFSTATATESDVTSISGKLYITPGTFLGLVTSIFLVHNCSSTFYTFIYTPKQALGYSSACYSGLIVWNRNSVPCKPSIVWITSSWEKASYRNYKSL